MAGMRFAEWPARLGLTARQALRERSAPFAAVLTGPPLSPTTRSPSSLENSTCCGGNRSRTNSEGGRAGRPWALKDRVCEHGVEQPLRN